MSVQAAEAKRVADDRGQEAILPTKGREGTELSTCLTT